MLYVSDTTPWCCMEVEQYNFERDILNSLVLAAAVCNFFPFKKSQKRSLDWSFLSEIPVVQEIAEN